MAYSSQVGVGGIGSFWVGGSFADVSPQILPTGLTRRALGTPRFGNVIAPGGYTRRAFGTAELRLGSLAGIGYTRRAIGTPGTNVKGQGFTRRAFGTPHFNIQAAGYTRRAFGTAHHVAYAFKLAELSRRAFGSSVIVAGRVTPVGYSRRKIGVPFLYVTHGIQFWIAGSECTGWITEPLQRSWQLGSICTVSFLMRGDINAAYRPPERSSVVILLGSIKWFDGWIDNYEEKYEPGPSWYSLTVNCTGFAAALEASTIGIDINSSFLDIRGFMDFIGLYLGRWGISISLEPDVSGAISPQTFNWGTVSEALRTVCDQLNLVYSVDQTRTLRLMRPDTGRPAPFSIADANAQTGAHSEFGDWQQITIKRGGSYRNRQGVRNSQQLMSTDTAPAILGFSSSSSSRLSWMAWADDVDEQNATGQMVEAIQDARDLQTYGQAQAMAQVLLDEGVKHQLSATIEMTRDGIEPGHLLPINTTIPPMNDSLLVEQVDSVLAGPIADGVILFRHTVRVSNSRFRRAAGISFMQRLITAATTPPIDRTTFTVNFTLAETIEGVDNPGLTTGVKAPKPAAVKKGVGRNLVLSVRSPATTVAVAIDVKMNGTSILADGHPFTIPTGETFAIYPYAFNPDPLQVNENDTFEVEILTADPAFKDGTLMFTVYG